MTIDFEPDAATATAAIDFEPDNATPAAVIDFEPDQAPDRSFGSALIYGIDQPLENLGTTAEVLGQPEFGAALKNIVKAPENYESAASRFVKPQEGDFTLLGFAPAQLPRAIVEQFGQAAGSLISRVAGGLAGGFIAGGAGAAATSPTGPGAIVGGGVAAAPGVVAGQFVGPFLFGALQTIGPVALERARRNGRTEPTGEDIAASLTTAAASGALDSIGAQYLPGGKAVMGPVVERIIKGFTGEFLTETAQSVTEQFGQSVATKHGLEIDPREAVGEGVVGGGTGLVSVAITAPLLKSEAPKTAAAVEATIPRTQPVTVTVPEVAPPPLPSGRLGPPDPLPKVFEKPPLPTFEKPPIPPETMPVPPVAPVVEQAEVAGAPLVAQAAADTEPLSPAPEPVTPEPAAVPADTAPPPAATVAGETIVPPVAAPAAKAGEGGVEPQISVKSDETPLAAEKARTFAPDDTLIMHSPHTGEDVQVSYRGPLGDKSVVWTGKSQMAIPTEWLRHEGEPLPNDRTRISQERTGTSGIPSRSGEGGSVAGVSQEGSIRGGNAAATPEGAITGEGAGKAAGEKSGAVSVAEPPIPTSKQGLIEELLGPRPDANDRSTYGYEKRVKWDKGLKDFSKFKKNELEERVRDQRVQDKKSKERSERMMSIGPSVKARMESAGNSWRSEAAVIAAEHGIKDYVTFPDNTRGEEAARLSSWLADHGVKEIAAKPTPAAPAAKAGEGAEPTQQQYDAMVAADRVKNLKRLKEERKDLIAQYGNQGEKHSLGRMIGGLNPAAVKLQSIRGQIAQLERLIGGTKPEKPVMTPISGTNAKREMGLLYNVKFGERIGKIGKSNLGKWYAVENGEIVTQDYRTASEARDAWAKSAKTTPAAPAAPAPAPVAGTAAPGAKEWIESPQTDKSWKQSRRGEYVIAHGKVALKGEKLWGNDVFRLGIERDGVYSPLGGFTTLEAAKSAADLHAANIAEEQPAPTPARVQLKSGPATYSVVEQLAPQKGDQPGEVYFRVKNEKTGEEQTVEAADMKPVKAKGAAPKPAEAKAMKKKLRGSESGAIPASLFADIADFGARLYRDGMSFARWSADMVRHLGERVRSALKELWVGMLNPKGARNLRGEVIQKRDEGGAIFAAGGRSKPQPGAPVEGGREGEYYTRVAERDKGTLSDEAFAAVRRMTTIPDEYQVDVDAAAALLDGHKTIESALRSVKAMRHGAASEMSGVTDRQRIAALFLITQKAAQEKNEAKNAVDRAFWLGIEVESLADLKGELTGAGKALNMAGQLYARMPKSADAMVLSDEALLHRMTGGEAAEVEATRFMSSLSEAMRKELAEAMLGQPWSVVNQLEMVRVIAKLTAEGYAGKLNFEFKVTPPSKGTRQIVLPGLAGMRESLASMLAKGLERNWWQALAGPRAPVGPLTAGVNSTQNQLAGILRQVMEARKLVNKEQAAKLTDAEKVAMFIGKKQLTEEAVAKLDESVSEEIEKRATEAIEAADDANKPAVEAQWAAIRDAWEEATSSMNNRPASNATMRRMIHAEAKESKVDWDAEMDAANDAALAQRLAAALVERVKAETSGKKLPGFPALDLEALRVAALEQAQTVVAAKRIKYTERMIARAQAEFNKALVSAEYAKQAPQREAEAIIRAHSPIIAKLNLPDAVRKAVRDLFTEQFRANPERNQATFERDMTALGVPAEAATRLYQIANTHRGIREAAQKLAQYQRATGKGAQRQAMSDEMKAAEESIRNILMNKGRQTWDQVRENLINGALNRIPFATTADRDAAADAMIADFKARMEKAKASALKALDRGTPKERQKAKTINEKLFKLFELGALDDAAASRVFMEKAGVQEFTPAFRDKLKKMYEDAEAAPEGMPRERILGNIAVELAMANPKTFGFWWNLAMSISYGNILGAFTTIFVNNPLGSAATAGEMTIMAALSNKGARRETLKGAVKTWARSFGDGVAMMRDLWSTGENLQKVSQFDSALVNSPVELLAKMAEDPAFPKKFKLAAKAVSQYKWVMRAMMAADAVIRWPAREALRFTQSAALAKETRRPGQSLEDAVDELNYPGGRQAAVREARAQAAQERRDGTLKTKLDERLRVIQLLQSKLSAEGTEAATESDELANYGSLLNDQPQDFIGVIASAILKVAFPSNTKSDLQKALGGAAQPFVRFVRTSANATRVMLDYAVGYGAFRYMTRNWPVIGADSLAGGVNLIQPGGKHKMSEEAAIRAGDRLTQVRIQRAYLGMALYAGLAAIYAAIDDDEEDPYIDFIGSGPTTPDERRRVRESGVRLNSIKIGNTYIPTSVGPLQPLAGIIAPFQRMRDNKKWPKAKDEFDERVPEMAGVAAAKGIADAMMNQSFTRSLADLLTMMNTGKTSFGETPTEFIGKNVSQFIPGNLRGLSQLDEIARGKKERADGFFDTAANAIAFYAPNGRATTILGDEVDAGKSVAQKAGEKVFQFTTLADDKTLQFVVKNGMAVPDRQRKRDGRRQTYLEYSAYMRESGKMMRAWLESGGMEALQKLPAERKNSKGKTVYPRKEAMNDRWKVFRNRALVTQ